MILLIKLSVMILLIKAGIKTIESLSIDVVKVAA